MLPKPPHGSVLYPLLHTKDRPFVWWSIFQGAEAPSRYPPVADPVIPLYSVGEIPQSAQGHAQTIGAGLLIHPLNMNIHTLNVSRHPGLVKN